MNPDQTLDSGSSTVFWDFMRKAGMHLSGDCSQVPGTPEHIKKSKWAKGGSQQLQRQEAGADVRGMHRWKERVKYARVEGGRTIQDAESK